VSSSRRSRPRAAFVALAVTLAGCAEIEGLGRFSELEDQPLPALDEAGSTSGGGPSPDGSDEDVRIVLPPDADADPDAGTDADAGSSGDVTPPPPPPPLTNFSLGATASAHPPGTIGAPTSVNDGDVNTYWSPGFACMAASGGTAPYDCTLQGQVVEVTIAFPVAHDVGRVVVRAPTMSGSTGILTATLTISTNAGPTLTEPLSFPVTGDATFTFPVVKDAVQVTVQLLTTSSPLAMIGELEIYGS
jgi:hypothetical protein